MSESRLVASESGVTALRCLQHQSTGVVIVVYTALPFVIPRSMRTTKTCVGEWAIDRADTNLHSSRGKSKCCWASRSESSSDERSDELLSPPSAVCFRLVHFRVSLPNERKELPTPIQYPRASDKRAVATMEGTNDGNDGGDTAAFSGIGFLDINTLLLSNRRIGSLRWSANDFFPATLADRIFCGCGPPRVRRLNI